MKINGNKLQCEEDRTKTGYFIVTLSWKTLLGLVITLVSINTNIESQSVDSYKYLFSPTIFFILFIMMEIGNYLILSGDFSKEFFNW